MTVVSWLGMTAVISLLSAGWWIVVPFYLGSYRTSKPVTVTERATTLVAGLMLAAGWWLVVVKQAPFNT